MSYWLLPENLADILPAEARRIEELRRELLDLYRAHGCELVAPPLVEYIDSLLSGGGADLNLRTFKLVDQLSGRTLGVRADITTQAARIDAHLLNRESVARLCYCGPVLHARPAGLMSDRELLQVGVEIFGHAGVEADIEIIGLALESARRVGVRQARVDLNHAGIGRALIEADPALIDIPREVIALLVAKDVPGLRALTERVPSVQASSVEALCNLAVLYGTDAPEVLARARRVLPALPAVRHALDSLDTLLQAMPGHQFSVDLADMGSGYAYHSGVMFSIYADGWHDALVRGGRYDGLGRVFGRSRPATGFSLDLRRLSAGLPPAAPARAIRAPWGTEASLLEALARLRDAGEIVIRFLPGQASRQDEFLVDRELILEGGSWQVRAVAEAG